MTTEVRLCEADARTATLSILDAAGYRRVIVIDDEAPSEPWLSLAAVMSAEDREQIGADLDLPFQFGQEGWEDRISSLDSDQRKALVGAVHRRASEIDLTSDDQAPGDLSALGRLLKDGPSVVWCTPEEWQESGATHLADSEDQRTLLLVDRDLGEHGDGLRLVHDALKSGHDGVKLGVLTATVSRTQEFEAWLDICESNGWDIGQVGLVSKDHLVGDPIGFPRMLKMSLTAGRVIEIRNQLIRAFSDAADAATGQVEAISVPLLVHMVFESSHIEGVDEPTTMLRLLYAYLHDEVDQRVYASEEIRVAVNTIRDVVTVATGEDERLAPLASELHSTERYIGGYALNSSFRQLDCGDVFRDGDGSYWVLCEQACDVILRKSGKRLKHDRLRVVPVQMRKSTPGVPNFRLRDFPWKQDLEKDAFALPTQSTSIPAEILDLTSMRADGEASYPLDDPERPLSTAGMEARRRRISGLFEKLLEDLDLDDEKDRRIGEAELPRSEHPEISPTITKSSDSDRGWLVNYGIERVGRLRESAAEAVLSTFGLAVSRSAETHDLARIADD